MLLLQFLMGIQGIKLLNFAAKIWQKDCSKTHFWKKTPAKLLKKVRFEFCNVLTCFIVFRDIDADFLKLAKQNSYTDGTTCLLALINNCKLTVANVGDSTA